MHACRRGQYPYMRWRDSKCAPPFALANRVTVTLPSFKDRASRCGWLSGSPMRGCLSGDRRPTKNRSRLLLSFVISYLSVDGVSQAVTYRYENEHQEAKSSIKVINSHEKILWRCSLRPACRKCFFWVACWNVVRIIPFVQRRRSLVSLVGLV